MQDSANILRLFVMTFATLIALMNTAPLLSKQKVKWLETTSPAVYASVLALCATVLSHNSLLPEGETETSLQLLLTGFNLWLLSMLSTPRYVFGMLLGRRMASPSRLSVIIYCSIWCIGACIIVIQFILTQ